MGKHDRLERQADEILACLRRGGTLAGVVKRFRCGYYPLRRLVARHMDARELSAIFRRNSRRRAEHCRRTGLPYRTRRARPQILWECPACAWETADAAPPPTCPKCGHGRFERRERGASVPQPVAIVESEEDSSDDDAQ